jgi:hypothetical protein
MPQALGSPSSSTQKSININIVRLLPYIKTFPFAIPILNYPP